MKVSLLLASLTLVGIALIAGCDKTTASNPGVASHRTISSSLATTCPNLDASPRAMAASEPVGVEIIPPKRDSILLSIYDTTGGLIVESRFVEAFLGGSDTAAPAVAWNGYDANGNAVPAGHYFMFITRRDSAGTVVRADSNCIGLKR